MDWNWLKNLPDFIFRRQEFSLEDFRKLTDAASQLNDWLRSILPIAPEIVTQMTYSEAIAFFVDHRPADPRVVKGAMFLQRHPQGHLLVQVFLGKSSNLVCDPEGKPYGRRLVVRNIDPELQHTFGSQDLVIVE
jgi:hypothetical protein